MATSSVNLSEFNLEDLPDCTSMRFGIVVSEWNSEITEALYKGALETLKSCGTSGLNIRKILVPGTFELTHGARMLCAKGDLDAVIVIGNVVKGETRHFDFVCHGVTQGITQLNVQYETPVIFCVLTDDNIQQSRERSGGKYGNKGVESAVAAIKMAGLKNIIK